MTGRFHRRTLRVLASGLFFMFCVSGLSAQDFRNIAAFRVDSYFDDTFGTTVNNVFIAPVIEDRLQLHTEVRNETDNRFGNTRALTGVHFGPIFLLTDHLYGLTVYGAGLRDSGSIVHELRADVHYETAGYRIDGGFRGFLEPDADVAYLVSSIGGRLQFPMGAGLLAKYFAGYNNDGDFSNAVWVEGDYTITPAWSAKAGATVGTGESAGTNGDVQLQFTLIAGFSVSLSDRVSLRYQFDYVDNAEQPDGIGNLLLVDWRF